MSSKTIFLEAGDRALVLFHAFTSNPNDVYSLANRLHKEGYTVYAPTLSGHDTGNPDDIFQVRAKDFVQDGQDAIRFLKDKGYQQLAAFGLSLGGLVATALAVSDEDLKAFGTFSSPLVQFKKGSNVPENFEIWYTQSLRALGDSAKTAQEKFDQNESQMYEILESLHQLVSEELMPHYDELTLPFFARQGWRDEMIDPKPSENLEYLMPNVEIFDFDYYMEAPHVITIGKHGKLLQEELLNFLAQIDWR